MKKFRFQGYSDDTFGEYEATGIDYDNCASMKPIRFQLDSNEGSMIVIGQYSRIETGCWDIGIAQVEVDCDKYLPIPNWNMSFSSSEYSVILDIEVPDDTTIRCLEEYEEQ